MIKYLLLSAIGFVAALVSIGELNRWNSANGYFPRKGELGNIILSGKPELYQKSNHVTKQVGLSKGEYQVQYKFKDHQGYARNWNVTFPESITNNATKTFGIPKAMLEPYYATPDVLAQRKKWLKDGMFITSDNTLLPEYSKIATYYKGFTKPIAEYAKSILGANASQEETVEFLLRFCQDIPYGVPPSYFNGKYTGGMFSPAQALVNMYADCDSKAVLFASAYSHLRNEDLLFVHTPGHLSLAIQGIPKPYQHGMTYKNKKYIFAEPVGPGRFKFGQENLSTNQIDRIDASSIGDTYPDSNYSLQVRGTANEPKREYVSNGGQVNVYLTSADYGYVTVYIDGEEVGELTSYFNSEPECNADGAVTFSRKVGDYHFKAVSTTNVYWEGDISIGNGDCFLMGIGD